jgi:peptide chain release factor
MLMLQITAGDGPAECCLAVAHALKVLMAEADRNTFRVTLMDTQEGPEKGTFQSALISVDTDDNDYLQTRSFFDAWNGSIQWVCQSPYRPKHKRKNWFIAGEVFELTQLLPESDIQFEACRSSGAGGQHVNKTNSAIWATHVATGLKVKVQTERSQHANKRLAKALLAHKLEQMQTQAHQEQQQLRWYAHKTIERGNPIMVFKGPKFIRSV